jgi:hypothetical protein
MVIVLDLVARLMQTGAHGLGSGDSLQQGNPTRLFETGRPRKLIGMSRRPYWINLGRDAFGLAVMIG